MSTTPTHLVDVNVLIVEDENVLGWSIEQQMIAQGATCARALTCVEAKYLFTSFEPDVVVCDLMLPDGDGLELVKAWRVEKPTVPIVIMTAHGGVDSAVSAVRLSAFDYIQKPFDLNDLTAAVVRAAEVSVLREKVRSLESSVKQREAINIMGDSASTKKLRRTLTKIAASRVDTVIVIGATGTGKELAARALHEWSADKDKPYIEINCASIPENLLESELFGYEKGAFTDAKARKLGLLELAGKGTLYLDEVGELPPKLQAKLLRVLEYRRFRRLGGTSDLEFNARVVAATNRDLEAEIEAGNFRADLFYRLSAIPIHLSPLAERKEDIPSLVDLFLASISKDLHIKRPEVQAGAMQLLKSHDWPGNVRELRNCLKRALVFEETKILKPEHFAFLVQEPRPHVGGQRRARPEAARNDGEAHEAGGDILDFKIPESGIALEEVEKSLLLKALRQSRYNQSRAAELLKISRHTLRYRLEKYHIEHD